MKSESNELLGRYLARREDGKPEQPLQIHLEAVARTAAQFATWSGLEAEARHAGLLHDLGKYRQAFQEYLAGRRPGGEDTWHAADGAVEAARGGGLPQAFAIAGHHAGLHDLTDLQALITGPRAGEAVSLLQLLQTRIAMPEYVPSQLVHGLTQTLPDRLTGEFATRMVFSALVDADRLDAAFWPDAVPAERTLGADAMLEALKSAIIRRHRPESTMQASRDMVFAACLSAGVCDQGFFSLTVPTGGGKTLASMAFALEHARVHGLRRVVVVIPYLSIIEQNAAEYAQVFGPDAVLECHSAVEASVRAEAPAADIWSENWDAPLIVTTSVQFLESILAAAPARCRKLHRLARSVVIFDEVQTMPAHLLRPALSVMRELRERYCTSFLLCSATSPAFRTSSNLVEGFGPTELQPVIDAASTARLFRDLRRVRYRLPAADATTSWADLATAIAAHPQGLCVVNTTRHARLLWQELRNRTNPVHKPFHLSAFMCAQHRFDKLAQIRLLLRNGAPCRLISTQLIEAGVDIDFPVVWRAFGPLDAIVQTAGRCNREGRLRDADGRPRIGDVHVFRPEDKGLPRGVYSTATDQAAVELARLSAVMDPGECLATDAGLFERYFDALHGIADVGADIQKMRTELKFRSVAEEAKVISGGKPVVVRYGIGPRLLDELRRRVACHAPPAEIRAGFRAMQRYMVNLHTRDFERLMQMGAIVTAWEGAPLLALKDGFYHDDLGIAVEDRPPEDLIV